MNAAFIYTIFKLVKLENMTLLVKRNIHVLGAFFIGKNMYQVPCVVMVYCNEKGEYNWKHYNERSCKKDMY